MDCKASQKRNGAENCFLPLGVFGSRGIIKVVAKDGTTKPVNIGRRTTTRFVVRPNLTYEGRTEQGISTDVR